MTDDSPPTALTPYFTVDDPAAFITFVEKVLGGQLLRINRYDSGVVQHARMRIADAVIMLNQTTADYAPTRAQMHLDVGDVDATYARALTHGATSVMAPTWRPHGAWMAGFTDRQGTLWWVSSPAPMKPPDLYHLPWRLSRSYKTSLLTCLTTSYAARAEFAT